MTLVPRTLRNLWHNVEGVFTKYVNEDDADHDAVDFTDELETNQAVSSAAFEDVSGVTLGTPSISAGVVSFTHIGAGSAVLQVVLDFVAYVASLISLSYDDADYWLKVSSVSAPGTFPGASVGDSVAFYIEDKVTGLAFGDSLDGATIFVTTPATAAVIEINDLVWNGGTALYTGTLADDLDTTDDKVYITEPVTAVPADDVAAYEEYLTKPARTLHRKLAFTDPSSPDTDYTP